jgi:hypothetical protein
MDKVPIYLCCWHVLKTWRLRGTEKIKDVEVSINHGETIDDFKQCGKIVVRKSFHNHRSSDAWTNYFWTYYHFFGK